MNPRSAIKTDLMVAYSRSRRIDSVGDPLIKISQVVNFAALAGMVERLVPRAVPTKGGRPVFLTRLIPWCKFWFRRE